MFEQVLRNLFLRSVTAVAMPLAVYSLGHLLPQQVTAQGALNVWRSSGPNASMTTVIIDPFDPNIIYAGGSGVFKSINKGASWVQLGLVGASDLSVDHVNRNTIYAAYGGVYKSADGGLNWTQLPGANGATKIQVSPNDPNFIVAAAFNDFRIFVSSNGGATWETRLFTEPLEYLDALEIDPQNPNNIYVAYVTPGELLELRRSRNAGVAWEGFDYCPSDPCQPGELIAASTSVFMVDPNDSNIVYASVYTDMIGSPAYSLFTSIDGGANWTQGGIMARSTTMAIPKGTPRVIYSATNDEVFRSFGEGGAWLNVSKGLQQSVYELAFDRSGRFLYAATEAGVFSVRLQANAPFDYDGDGRTDLSVYRPSNGTWYVARSLTSDMYVRPFGEGFFPADFDGDGKTDIAKSYLDDFNGDPWIAILNSSTNTLSGGPFFFGDRGLAADFDGDGKADPAVWTAGQWQIAMSLHGTYTQQWGVPGDKPVPGDFDGDGKAELAVFRPSEGKWYVANISTGSITTVNWGVDGDIPVVGDYNGDGRADFAVYRPSNNTWYRRHSSDNSMSARMWGVPNDIVTPGDYDGDGRTDLAVFRPSEGKWYVMTAAQTILTSSFGQDGDVPTPSAFIY